ncbi:hypothetical protein [Lysinibacillus parviboronicapiens]|nr:hypothetical protein [Lysinibacillus parviboronicapiens]
MKKKVYVLYGGKSCEHEVSVASAIWIPSVQVSSCGLLLLK